MKPKKLKRSSGKTKKKSEIQGYLRIGEVTHFFPNVNAGVLVIKQDQLVVGEEIMIKGATTSFKQRVKSLQIDRKPIDMAVPGDEVGIQVKKRVRAGDIVYKKE